MTTTTTRGGRHNVTFTVTDSAGHETSVTRLVKLLVECETGEVRCADGLTCVQEGIVCESDIVGSIEEAAELPISPATPNVTVIGDRVLMLPRFTQYAMCSPGQIPTSDLPCELGATSEGAHGNALLVCPPDHCLRFGCAGHELWRKGISACVNTMAPVGTTFVVSYVVFNSAGVMASDERVVIVAEPCGEGEHWCPSNDPSGRCENAACEIVDTMMAGEENDVLIADVERTPSLYPKGPDILWRTPHPREQPFAFLFGQAPWLEKVGDTANANPLAACRGKLDRAFFPSCLAKARDAIDGDVTNTLHVYSSQNECSPQVFVAGLCLPGTHLFHVSAYDRDGNRGYGDAALMIDIVEGWEETYEVYRDWLGTCEIYLDPRLDDSAEVRESVALELGLARGRVRVISCHPHEEENGIKRARLEITAIFSLHGDISSRRKLRQFDDLILIRSGTLTADPRGSWYAQQRSQVAALRIDDLALRGDRATIGTNLTAQQSIDWARLGSLNAMSARIEKAFLDGVSASRQKQEVVTSRASKVAETTSLAESGDEKLRRAESGALVSQENNDRLMTSLIAAIEAVEGVNNGSRLGSVGDCRGANGARLSYYTVNSNGRTARGVWRDTSPMIGSPLKHGQRRFEDLYREMQCSTLDGGAYGFDAMFAHLDLPAGVTDPTGKYPGGLYNPSLRRIREAFYNESELASPDVPFAFFGRNYDEKELSSDVEKALFDVYLDGTLMQDRAKFLLSYLYHSRFIDRRTRRVDIRVLLHNELTEMLVDVRIHMEVSSHGRISTTTEAWKLPVFDYFMKEDAIIDC